MRAVLVKNKTILQSVDDEKNELAIKLLSLKDQSMIHTFKLIFDDLMSAAKKTKRTTKATYNKDVDAAIKRVRSGKSISNDDVMNEMDKW